MSLSPKVSIILPVYNGEKFLSESIESCLNQTYNNIELIIVNDCSTDSSLKIANEFTTKDNRVTVINNLKNQKLPKSLNIGHKKATGRYISWTSHDNVYKCNAIEEYVIELEENNADFVCSNYDIINDEGKLIKTKKIEDIEKMFWGNIFGASFMYKREVYFNVGGYNEDFFLVEDYDFWLKLILKYNYHKISKHLYLYRLHEISLTNAILTDPKKYLLWKDNLQKMFKNFIESLGVHEKTADVINSFFVDSQSKNFNYKTYKVNYKRYFREFFDILEYKFGMSFLEKFKLTLSKKIFNSLKKSEEIGFEDILFLLLNKHISLSKTNYFILFKRIIKNRLLIK